MYPVSFRKWNPFPYGALTKLQKIEMLLWEEGGGILRTNERTNS